MNAISYPPTAQYVYRVDKFSVPLSGRNEFVSRVMETHEYLRRQPGLVEDFLLEKPDGPETCTIITVAIWEDQESVDAAMVAVTAWRQQTGFDALRLIRKLDIQADRGNYRSLHGRTFVGGVTSTRGF